MMQRAGHRNFATTQGYIREAEAVRDGFGDVFPALPGALLEASGVLPQFCPGPPKNREFLGKSQRRGRDSNPLDLSREESRNGLNQAGSGEVGATARDETRRAEPELIDADAALRVAIKAAVDAGQWQRVEALMAIARASAG